MAREDVTHVRPCFFYVHQDVKLRKGKKLMSEHEMNQTQQSPAESPQTDDAKTFTQEEVNHIIGERLARERDKYLKEVEHKQAELNQRELALMAKEKIQQHRLPADLLDVLNYEDEATLDKAIEVVKSVMNQQTAAPQSQSQEPPVKRPPTGMRHGSSISGKNDQLRQVMGLE